MAKHLAKFRVFPISILVHALAVLCSRTLVLIVSPLRSFRAWLAMSLLVAGAAAQVTVRPGDGGIGTLPANPGGGIVGGGAGGGGGGAGGGGNFPVNPGGGPINTIPGGGGGTSTPEPVIAVARGALAGQSLTATAVVITTPTAAQGGGQATTTPAATYQWSISGGRITSDPRERTVEFVADRAGIVTLTVTIGANGTSYTPSAQVTVLSADAAGAMASPATVATNAASLTASMPPAQNGDRTFRWIVSGDATIASGQGTASVTLRPGTPGLKEITCNVVLQNLVTAPVRAYLVVTGDGAPVAVTVNRGSGGGTYRARSRVDIFADPPATGQVFDRWTGDTEVLGNGALAPALAHTTFTVPGAPVTLAATYKAAPAWTPTSVRNFNPQLQAAANGVPATMVATALAYHVPANATGLVFLLHDSGGSGADWFDRPEQVLLARDLVAAGYGVAALNSLNRTVGAWAAQTSLASNLDALNHAAALDWLTRDGTLAATQPVFLIGVGNGADAAARIAEQLATARPARPIKGAVLYLSAGSETLAVTSRVPQFFALAANDETLGAIGLASARENSQLLSGRGVATAMVNNSVSPVHPGRFRALGLNAATVSATDAQAIWTTVKNADALDPNNYVKSLPSAATLAAALPPAYRNRANDVVAQLAVASAAREFYADANARVIAFLNNRVADAPVPPPGRLVNLSTRSQISYLGDAFTLGFTLSGTQRATLLIRGIGPALAKFGVAGAIPALRLELGQGRTLIASNEAWNRAANATQIATAAASVGAFTLAPADLDTAVLVQLDPGAYVATITGVNGAIGNVLGEIYDVSRNGTRLTNLSILANISTAGELLIPGLVVAGNNPRTLVVRAVGPGLADFGLPPDALLGDPRISILNGTQTIATNNNWAQAGAATLAAAFPIIGAFPLRDANDAALVNALAPGSYTLQAGAAPPLPTFPGNTTTPLGGSTPATTGAVLVEVYEVP